MIPGKRRSIAVIAFTVLIIIMVNVAWWLFYGKIKTSFETQLARRLTALVDLGSAFFQPQLIDSLKNDYLSAYNSTLEIIEDIHEADSLSEVFLVDADYTYLATTNPYPDSIYYLAVLNGPYIDSLFSLNWIDSPDASIKTPIITPDYRVGDIVLKSAFAPLYDTAGLIIAVMGIEADVDYTRALVDIRRNLYISTSISIGAGLVFGVLFFLAHRRLAETEKSLFLSQSQANLGRMVAIVSHEIKNPLAIIRAAAERLQKNGPEEASFIIEETDRLNNIVTGYLDFALGKRTIKKSTVELSRFLTDIARRFAPRLTKDGINLTVDNIDNDIFVHTDPVALRQVIINLILNGAEAVKGKEKAVVKMKCIKKNNMIKIAVTDNGPGIPEKQLKSIFEPFYTTKTTGSGLGLYHSRRLVEQMGGRISAFSKESEKTEFAITLPVTDRK